MPFRMEYRLADYAGHMTGEDVGCARLELMKWWEKAARHVPHLAGRYRVVCLVITRPEHISLAVNLVADAYRFIFEKDDAESTDD